MCSRNQFLLHLFYTTLLVIINCETSDVLKGKQVSLVKRFSNNFFQCLQSSLPASTRSLQLPFVNIPQYSCPSGCFKVASHPKCDHFGEKNILRWQDRPYSYLCLKKEISKKYCFCGKLWTK